MSFEFGARHGDYQIFEELGQGSFGKVYKILNVPLQRWEAMKTIRLTGEEQWQRIKREFEIQSALVHDHVAALYGAFRFQDYALLMMELAPGPTVKELLARGPLPVAEAVRHLVALLSALEHAHSHTVIHRDVKPANLKLSAAGDLKLLDFGIAKRDGDLTLTAANCSPGSPHYMSPEQINGRKLDARSDLFSVGIVAYEMLTGAKPFDGEDTVAIMHKTLLTPARDPLELRPDLPEELARVVQKALQKDPAMRFQTAREYRDALEEAARKDHNPVVWRKPPGVPQPDCRRLPFPRGRRRALLYLVAALVLSVSLFLRVELLADTPLETINKVSPEYTVEARRANLEGSVVLDAVVQPDGWAHDIQVVKPLGLGLDEKAVEALRQWKFKPARKSGASVQTGLTMAFEFKLDRQTK